MGRRLLSFPGLTGAFVFVLGLALAALGGWLAVLGGTLYYVAAGLALMVAGALYIMRNAAAPWIYLATFVATAGWALAEVGLDGWKLMPRLFGLAVLGVWCSMPWIVRPVSAAGPMRRAAGAAGIVYIAAIIGVFVAGWRITDQRFVRHEALPPLAGPAGQGGDAGENEWRYYGRTPAGDRYSPLAALTPANVGQLRQAWRYDTGDLPQDEETSAGREFNFEVTPTQVGNRLYLCTPHRRVIALDATTGRPIWTFDPHTDTSANEYLACRGVAYYDTAAPGTPCPRRVITTTGDARMVALDADTGRPCEGFGRHGFVSLTDHLGKVPPGFHFITSQPLVIRDRVVLGGWIYDNQARGEPSGVVRAYDARSGRPAWSWDMGRPDPTAPPGPGETYTRGTPNGWGSYTADPRLGLVYVPLGNATPDYYGAARRPFDDAYSSALVALDAETGRERWHFQTVHHDVWDFDLPVGPSLVDLPGPGGSTVPALVQTTKLGQLFLLDRRTGRPLADVAEKPVPTRPALPGERLSPTQPYSTGMPTLAPPDLSERDMWGATPVDQLWCRIQFRRANYAGQYTPPAPGTSIEYPAFDGVVDWYGASIDPVHRLLVANASYIPFTMEMLPSAQAIERGLMKPWAGWDSGQPYPKPKEFAVGPQYGTPYAAVVKPWLTPLGAPCSAPPWGRLVAIDLQTRKIAWERPVGTTRDMNLLGTHTNAPLPTGIFMIGGNIVTAGGLVFMGATADDYLRAFDERTGRVLWKARVPAGGQATPITYMGADGRQYVVIAAGGHGGLRTRLGDSIVAYALPKKPP
ncbi:glucose/quinate/shikimate family membrane-bound PQQ-dependent dehydrogenase [Pigmentiphaga soli]|uniref:Glucose/quinate/shikimate family membrane-bound PQQ-dependent dehydrogenase n=1 Tax=Pigmentiphaga soli TaxID=1007095 RepID=A0ABP8GVT4_9BURK